MFRSLMFVVVAIVSSSCGIETTTSTSTTTSKFTCRINGACFTCPSSDAAFECVSKGGTQAGCTSAVSTECD